MVNVLAVFSAKQSSQKGGFVLVWQWGVMVLYTPIHGPFVDDYVSTAEYKGVCDLFINNLNI
jgi:hypothetical protein